MQPSIEFPPFPMDGLSHMPMRNVAAPITVQPGLPPTAPLMGDGNFTPGSTSPMLSGWQQQQPNMTCPPGLEFLITLDHFFIDQKIELLEVVTGLEATNKYVVLNKLGQPVLYIHEKSNFCARQCLGSLRSCEFKIFNLNNVEVLRMTRPFSCNSCWCPCWLQEISVYSNGYYLGSIKQEWSLLRPLLTINNKSDNTVLRIRGPIFTCCEANFAITSSDGKHEVGLITKKWGGMLRELFTESDVFGARFPLDLNVEIKAVLLGASILLDFMYYQDTTD